MKKFGKKSEKNINKKNLIKIIYKKEKVHYKRMKLLFLEMENVQQKIISFPLLFIFVSIFRYAFALMHYTFEFLLFFVNKDQYKQNIKNINSKTNATINELEQKIKILRKNKNNLNLS